MSSHSLTHCILLAVIAVGALAQERPVPGSIAGTERWIVWLRDRSFDLRQELQQIRAMSTSAARNARLAQLDAMAAADQREFSALLATNGGVVHKHYWVLSALAVDLPPAVLPLLRSHPRVRSIVPVRSRNAGEVDVRHHAVGPVLLPIATSTDSNNHNVGRARTIITNSVSASAARGSGVRVAFFDTGIDLDAGGAPHPSFRQPPPSGGVSRIVKTLRAGTIDRNNISTSGAFPGPAPFAYRPCIHSGSAPHGTAMAAIAAGNADTLGFGFVDGHVPEASIVDVSITTPPAQPVNPLFPDRERWSTDDATMLAGIQMMESFIVEVGLQVQVLNISFAGFADPQDPVSTALDELALSFDVLLVTSCGNAAEGYRRKLWMSA